MGDSLVSGLVSDVVRKLTSIVSQEIGLLRRLKDDVLNLKNAFNQIQAVLHDAEEKHTKEEVVQLWLKSLKYASLQIENVLDEVSTEALLQKLHIQRGIIYRVRAFFSSDHNHLMVQTRIVHKVKTIRIKLDAVASKRFELNLTPGGITNIDAVVGCGMPNRETSSLIHSSNIFGRNDEMEMVVEKICNKNIRKHDVDDIRVYAIWGMGGMGKTTLAQLVYNHERVDECFEFKCWIYVSKNFQVKEILKGILESVDKEILKGTIKSIDKSDRRLSQLDEIQKELREKLQGKRFLIVLDDVWIEDNENTKWEHLSETLSCGTEGSIVVMTTRSKRTSRMMARVPELQHELERLSEHDSWSLFKNFAFARGREGGDIAELKPIGKKIVKKCKGLPLALKILGSLLWSKSSTHDWHNVMGSKIWELEENDIMSALKLSYDSLLPHLKQCFAYCCMFPKGYEMKKDLLILLWMANGFIPPRGETNWYVLGEEIYNCLVWRSFIQVVDGKYKMHDLMHDLAENVMRHDCLIIEPNKKLITQEEMLHLSSSCPDFVFSNKDLKSLRSLRSVIILKAYDYIGSIMHIFDFVNLRVLYMVGIGSSTLPKSISKLKYLKYLNLSESWIEVLPESIIYLQNLQVLLLEWCGKLRKLPEGMRYMRNLQHLNIKGCFSLKYLCVEILKELTCLRLTHFPIGKKKGAKIGELGDLNLVEDELKIKGLENVKGGLSEAKNANLKSKTNLLVLRLRWDEDGNINRIEGDEEVLEGLEPNPSLKELEIYHCMGKNLSPSWIVNLKDLVKISFSSCTKCEQIPQLGKLPSLRVIELYGLYSLKYFNDDDNTTKSGDNTTSTLFPALQELLIYSCRNLVSLPSYFPKLKLLHITNCYSLLSLPSYFPKLNKLYIDSCNSLTSLPDEIQSFKDLNQLKIYSCENLSIRYETEMGVDWPKISHIPNIIITPISKEGR